jgi:hypothetical protein
LATAGRGCDRACVAHANATAAAAAAIPPKKRNIVRGSTDEMRSAAENWQCRIVATAAVHAQLRVRPTELVPSRPGNYQLRTSADCSPYRPSSLIRWRHYAEIIAAALQIAACTVPPTRQVILARSGMIRAAVDASVRFRRQTRCPRNRALQAEASGGPNLRLVVSHCTRWTRQVLQTRMIRKAAHLLGSALSIFRIWFAAGFDASMPMTLGSPLPVGPVGGALPIP